MKSSKMTVKNIAKIAKSKEFQDLKAAVESATIAASSIRPIVESYREPLFLSFGFVDAETKEPIAASKDAYLAVGEDDDFSIFEDYDNALHLMHKENGFYVEAIGHCPFRVLEYSQIKAEQALIEYMRQLIDMPEISRLDDRRKAIELYMSLK
jgi:hypothetical protein